MRVVDWEKKCLFPCLLPVQCFCLSANKSESSLTLFTEVTSVAKRLHFLTISIKFRLATGKKNKNKMRGMKLLNNSQISLGIIFPFCQQEKQAFHIRVPV